MGNCIRQQVSKDNQTDQSADTSYGSDLDDTELDTINNGIARRIRNDSFRNLYNFRRNGNSSNRETDIRLDNVDDQISLEDSASIPDIRGIHSESSNDLPTTSEVVIRPLRTGNHVVRRDSFGNEFTLPPDPYTLSNTSDIIGNQRSISRFENLLEGPVLTDNSIDENMLIDPTYIPRGSPIIIRVSPRRRRSLSSINLEHGDIDVYNNNASVESLRHSSYSDDSIDEIDPTYIRRSWYSINLEHDDNNDYNDNGSVESLIDGNSNDDFDGIEILFTDDTPVSGDKRVYFDESACEICVSEYDEKSHKPVILPCGHMLCSNCVRKISKKKNYRIMECPMDRQTHSITVTKAAIPALKGESEQFTSED